MRDLDRIAVMGAGAVGCDYGGMLARAAVDIPQLVGIALIDTPGAV
jgi:ketopantoate reductase